MKGESLSSELSLHPSLTYSRVVSHTSGFRSFAADDADLRDGVGMEQSHGLDELNRTVIAEGRCAACGACVSGCPYLTSFRGRTVVLDSCTRANGRCFQYCPMTFFDEKAVSESVFGSQVDAGPLGHFQRIFASRAVDSDITGSAQAGGVVTALMAMALQKGIVDCAVLTRVPIDQEFPQGVVTSSPTDVIACAGSQVRGRAFSRSVEGSFEQGLSAHRRSCPALPGTVLAQNGTL